MHAVMARGISGLGEILLEVVVEGLTIGGFDLYLLFQGLLRPEFELPLALGGQMPLQEIFAMRFREALGERKEAFIMLAHVRKYPR